MLYEVITRAASRQAMTGVGGLANREVATVHPAHLARADSERHASPCIDDRIGLHVLADAPGEQQVLGLLFRRLPPGHDAQPVARDAAGILP